MIMNLFFFSLKAALLCRKSKLCLRKKMPTSGFTSIVMMEGMGIFDCFEKKTT